MVFLTNLIALCLLIGSVICSQRNAFTNRVPKNGIQIISDPEDPVSALLYKLTEDQELSAVRNKRNEPVEEEIESKTLLHRKPLLHGGIVQLQPQVSFQKENKPHHNVQSPPNKHQESAALYNKENIATITVLEVPPNSVPVSVSHSPQPYPPTHSQIAPVSSHVSLINHGQTSQLHNQGGSKETVSVSHAHDKHSSTQSHVETPSTVHNQLLLVSSPDSIPIQVGHPASHIEKEPLISLPSTQNHAISLSTQSSHSDSAAQTSHFSSHQTESLQIPSSSIPISISHSHNKQQLPSVVHQEQSAFSEASHHHQNEFSGNVLNIASVSSQPISKPSHIQISHPLPLHKKPLPLLPLHHKSLTENEEDGLLASSSNDKNSNDEREISSPLSDSETNEGIQLMEETNKSKSRSKREEKSLHPKPVFPNLGVMIQKPNSQVGGSLQVGQESTHTTFLSSNSQNSQAAQSASSSIFVGKPQTMLSSQIGESFGSTSYSEINPSASHLQSNVNILQTNKKPSLSLSSQVGQLLESNFGIQSTGGGFQQQQTAGQFSLQQNLNAVGNKDKPSLIISGSDYSYNQNIPAGGSNQVMFHGSSSSAAAHQEEHSSSSGYEQQFSLINSNNNNGAAYNLQNLQLGSNNNNHGVSIGIQQQQQEKPSFSLPFSINSPIGATSLNKGTSLNTNQNYNGANAQSLYVNVSPDKVIQQTTQAFAATKPQVGVSFTAPQLISQEVVAKPSHGAVDINLGSISQNTQTGNQYSSGQNPWLQLGVNTATQNANIASVNTPQIQSSQQTVIVDQKPLLHVGSSVHKPQSTTLSQINNLDDHKGQSHLQQGELTFTNKPILETNIFSAETSFHKPQNLGTVQENINLLSVTPSQQTSSSLSSSALSSSSASLSSSGQGLQHATQAASSSSSGQVTFAKPNLATATLSSQSSFGTLVQKPQIASEAFLNSSPLLSSFSAEHSSSSASSSSQASHEHSASSIQIHST